MSDINKIPVSASITVKEFSHRLRRTPAEVITILIKNGVMANINEEIDFDTAALIAGEFDLEIEKEIESEDVAKEVGVRKQLIKDMKDVDESDLKERPPVVTIMGHVDHGKTKLLDAIRETNVIDTESGGITQHIGAYQAKEKGKLVTFLDTPGHEAFATMRERGAKITDIAILVVAADDGVKPQTKEAIKHIKKAGIPMIVAINKIDKPEADPERVKKELADIDVLAEEWGGDTIFVNISAKQKTNIDELLETILLVAEVEHFVANPKAKAIGTVIEAHKDPKRGPEATVLVQNGTLRLGDIITVGPIFGKIKLMENHLGKRINHAKPSTPVMILGLESVPESGDILFVEEDKSKAKQKIAKLRKLEKPRGIKTKDSGDDSKIKKFNIIMKADVQGSLEAVIESLEKIKSDEVMASIITFDVGKITESDIMMASSSGSTIYGFSTSVTPVAKRLAESMNVEIIIYDVIYDLIDDVKSKLSAMIEPEIKLTKLGKLEILALFRTEKGKMIVGGKVISGTIENSSAAKIMRKEEEVGEGKIVNLQTGKQDVQEVKQGNECGITFQGETKIKEGDILETWKEEIIKKTL